MPVDQGSYSFSLDADDTSSEKLFYVSPSAGDISLTTRLSQGSSLEISFYSGANKYPTFAVYLTDDDCTSGHKGTVRWTATAYERQQRYFEKEIPWGSDNKLQIRWGKDGHYTVLREGEAVSGKLHRKPYKVQLKALNGSTEVVQLLLGFST